MITRFYVDNYKCLVNFEYKPERFQLILGANGTGKTTFTEALAAVRALVVEGLKVEDLFRPRTLTAWQSNNIQSFELEIEGESGETFRYGLMIEHWRDKGTSHIVREELSSAGSRLFFFDGKEVHLFKDSGAPGPVFPGAWDRSLLGTVPSGPTNQKLTRFRELLSRIYRVRLNPFDMVSLSEREDSEPDYDLSNLSSWYRHLSQEDPESVAQLWASLKQVMPHFEIILLLAAGSDRREFAVKMGSAEESESHGNGTSNSRSSASLTFVLEDLSEGQRALIALYLLLHCGLKTGTTLLIDEPENFVALRELQPWLLEMQDRAEETDGQVLLISHNAEFIDQMALQNAVQFRRPNNRHTRPGSFETEGFDGLRPSQIVARGWNQ